MTGWLPSTCFWTDSIPRPWPTRGADMTAFELTRYRIEPPSMEHGAVVRRG